MRAEGRRGGAAPVGAVLGGVLGEEGRAQARVGQGWSLSTHESLVWKPYQEEAAGHLLSPHTRIGHGYAGLTVLRRRWGVRVDRERRLGLPAQTLLDPVRGVPGLARLSTATTLPPSLSSTTHSENLRICTWPLALLWKSQIGPTARSSPRQPTPSRWPHFVPHSCHYFVGPMAFLYRLF